MSDESNILGVVISEEAFVWRDHASVRPSDVVSQALMGCVVGIMDKKGNRVQIRMPDRYIGWVDEPRIRQMSRDELVEWRGMGMVLVRRRVVMVYPESGKPEPMMTLPYGAALPKVREDGDIVVVRLPDDRIGTLQFDEVVDGDALGWTGTRQGTVQLVMQDAKMLRAVAYTWGGTSAITGYDCSGFVQTIFRVHGYKLPRDADKQWEHGEAIESRNIHAGCLMFFRDTEAMIGKGEIVHVAIAQGPDGIVDAGSYWPLSLSKKSPYFSPKRATYFAGAKKIF